MSYQLNPLLLEDSPLYIPWSDKNYVGASKFDPRSVDVIDTPGRAVARKADVQAAFAPYKGKPLPSRSELRMKRLISNAKGGINRSSLIRSKRSADLSRLLRRTLKK